MKERPILFSGPMVRALIAGTKTQTRRVVKGRGWEPHHLTHHRIVQHNDPRLGLQAYFRGDGAGDWLGIACPYGQPGDRLWVREAWRTTSAWDRTPPRDLPGRVDLHYEASGRPNAHFCFGKLRPGMFMPRAASRILLEVTEVRVERLNDISEADAASEGLIYNTDYMGHWSGTGECWYSTAREAFRDLWKSINGAGSWDATPWVWAVSFRVIKGGQP